MRETTVKLEFDLERPAAAGASGFTLKAPGLTKSAAAGTAQAPATTVIHLDVTTPPATAPKKDDMVIVTGTGWPSVDGKPLRVTAFDATSGDLTVAVDTFAEAAALPTTLTDIKAQALTFDHVCFSEFTPNPGTPGEVDATTMCDDARVTLPGLPTPGTASFTGMFDLDDKGMLAVQAAEADALPRWLIARTRKGQMAVFHGVVSAFSIGGLGVEQAVTYTGNFTLDRRPTYAKAA